MESSHLAGFSCAKELDQRVFFVVCMTVSCTGFDQFMKIHFSFSIFCRTHVSESVHALSKVNPHFQEESSF